LICKSKAQLAFGPWISAMTNGFLTAIVIILIRECMEKLKLNCACQSYVEAVFWNAVSQIKLKIFNGIDDFAQKADKYDKERTQ